MLLLVIHELMYIIIIHYDCSLLTASQTREATGPPTKPLLHGPSFNLSHFLTSFTISHLLKKLRGKKGKKEKKKKEEELFWKIKVKYNIRGRRVVQKYTNCLILIVSLIKNLIIHSSPHFLPCVD